MKAIIYTRVSKKEQSTLRQIEEMKNVPGYDIQKVFSEKISGFSKTYIERPVLMQALNFLNDNTATCIMVSEISRLGRNTQDVLTLIQELKDKGIAIYIHNLGTVINTPNNTGEIFTRLIVTIMADLARLESEQLSLRIKSGIKARKASGLTTGRRIGSKESDQSFLEKKLSKQIIFYLNKGNSFREIQRILKCSPNTIQKVKSLISQYSKN